MSRDRRVITFSDENPNDLVEPTKIYIYSAYVNCTNCELMGAVDLMRGIRVQEADCPYCGCRGTLVACEDENGSIYRPQLTKLNSPPRYVTSDKWIEFGRYLPPEGEEDYKEAAEPPDYDAEIVVNGNDDVARSVQAMPMPIEYRTISEIRRRDPNQGLDIPEDAGTTGMSLNMPFDNYYENIEPLNPATQYPGAFTHEGIAYEGLWSPGSIRPDCYTAGGRRELTIAQAAQLDWFIHLVYATDQYVNSFDVHEEEPPNPRLLDMFRFPLSIEGPDHCIYILGSYGGSWQYAISGLYSSEERPTRLSIGEAASYNAEVRSVMHRRNAANRVLTAMLAWGSYEGDEDSSSSSSSSSDEADLW